MRALVVSLGSIARRHIRNLKAIAPHIEIAIWRQHTKGRSDLGDLEAMVEHVFFDFEKVRAWQPEIALITNPASAHIKTGVALAKEGCHLFIEKPLADTLTGADELLKTCRDLTITLMVGYNFRFCRSMQILRQAIINENIGRVIALRAEVGQYLPSWRPGKDYREIVSAKRSLGGGVLLELSHELDYVRWLIGEVNLVAAQTARLSDLDIDVEDIAELILRTTDGAIASVHLNMVQSPPMRMCRVIGTKGTLEWNGVNRQVRLGTREMNGWSDLVPAGSVDPNEMYIDELRHFLTCVEKQITPIVGGDDGIRVLELVHAAIETAPKIQVAK